MELVAVETVKGDMINVEKIPRKKRGGGDEERVEEGRAYVKSLRDKGVVVTWKMMKRLGVNSRYVGKMLDLGDGVVDE